MPICIAVHGLFADHAAEALARAGAHVISCDTVPHQSNQISVAKLLTEAMRELVV